LGKGKLIVPEDLLEFGIRLFFNTEVWAKVPVTLSPA
jgi:hypothetical protein